MQSVTVCRFHHNIIGFLGKPGIFDQRLCRISDIAGKYNFLLHTVLIDPHLYAGRAKQMTDIGKADIDSLTQTDLLIIGTRNQTFDRTVSILHGIERFCRFVIGTSLRLPVLPLRLLHLDMGTITQHDTAQVRGCLCCKNLSSESSCIQ